MRRRTRHGPGEPARRRAPAARDLDEIRQRAERRAPEAPDLLRTWPAAG
ncbi:hypothetical protein ACWFQ8_09785 [Streptomyces sp. NPDC055254]